ncbi:MAG: hypothetical protein ABEN55_08140 [Bradymonadaceae bacterium]
MLQQFMGDDSRSETSTASWLTLAAAVAVAAVGCGPVEPEPRTNSPPYIGEVSPSQSTRRVTGANTSVPLSANQLYDPDREESLSVRWVSSKRQFISNTTTDRVKKTTVNDQTFYLYEKVSVDIVPCNSRDPGDPLEGQETIWLYVSDRSIEQDSQGRVRPGRGGYLVSHAWVLEYTCT